MVARSEPVLVLGEWAISGRLMLCGYLPEAFKIQMKTMSAMAQPQRLKRIGFRWPQVAHTLALKLRRSPHQEHTFTFCSPALWLSCVLTGSRAILSVQSEAEHKDQHHSDHAKNIPYEVGCGDL